MQHYGTRVRPGQQLDAAGSLGHPSPHTLDAPAGPVCHGLHAFHRRQPRVRPASAPPGPLPTAGALFRAGRERYKCQPACARGPATAPAVPGRVHGSLRSSCRTQRPDTARPSCPHREPQRGAGWVARRQLPAGLHTRAQRAQQRELEAGHARHGAGCRRRCGRGLSRERGLEPRHGQRRGPRGEPRCEGSSQAPSAGPPTRPLLQQQR